LENLHVKAIFGRKKTVQSKSFPKWRFFGNLRVYILIVVMGTLKRHISLAGGTTSFGVFFVKIRLGELQEPKKREIRHPRWYGKSRIWGAKTPKGSAIKFGMPSDVQYFVTHTNFGEDWSKGFSVARGRILAFSIDLLRRL